jgi:hypothetical protein
MRPILIRKPQKTTTTAGQLAMLALVTAGGSEYPPPSREAQVRGARPAPGRRDLR